ncbi:MAG: ATP-binding cassette domain-containing protein [Planctomycetota bacterium]
MLNAADKQSMLAAPVLDTRDIVLECNRISHWFGDNKVLHDVNLKVIRGEIVALLGPSGCGKSTLLRAIVGTHPPRTGEVRITLAGERVSRVMNAPGRDRGIVYQQYSLFPFLTARENVAVGLMLDSTTLPFRFMHFFGKWRTMRKQHLAEAEELLIKLKMKHAIHLYPQQMSGGMRQRVAIAQALIMKPEILLLDEPFGALDEATREQLQNLLLTLYDENLTAKQKGLPPPYTIFIVTHEINEAIYVGDRVTALSQYWNWKDSGFQSCPGATILYDKMAPVYRPDQPRDVEQFAHQRDEIRRAAFNPANLQDRNEFLRFWDDVNSGKGEGVHQ